MRTKRGAAPDIAAILELIRAARSQGREILLETEGLALLRAAAIPAPEHAFVQDSRQALRLRPGVVPGEQVVVKVVSPGILHKSDVGGVVFVPNTPEDISRAVARMERKFKGTSAGYLISRFIRYSPALGNELLLGMRWTRDYGAIVTFGPGGIFTEFLAGAFQADRGVAIFSPSRTAAGRIRGVLERAAVTRLLSGGLRGQAARVDMGALERVVRSFAGLADRLMPEHVSELEINPLAVADGRLVALDILVKLAGPVPPVPPARPLGKLKNLLEARSAALVGVSEKINTGRVILNNMLRDGFDRSRLYVVKQGAGSIDGCRCVPEVASLPERVDLAVLSVPAASVSEIAASFISGEKTESMIIIPGGLEEKEGSDGIVSGMREALARARRSAWGGPVINGGNCLGIRSLPGRYDTMFIPEHKKSVKPKAAHDRLALVSQSGAFAIAKMDKLSGLAPKFSISIGNQCDLTLGDYAAYLKDDPELDVFAFYVEGFKPGDGGRFLDAARSIVDSGRAVILYRAGRSPEGRKATASHTASIAEDYAVTRALAAEAGVVVAETLLDFEGLVRLFVHLREKRPRGRRLGAVSNAGFECVAIADNLGRLSLPEFAPATARRLQGLFKRCRIDRKSVV